MQLAQFPTTKGETKHETQIPGTHGCPGVRHLWRRSDNHSRPESADAVPDAVIDCNHAAANAKPAAALESVDNDSQQQSTAIAQSDAFSIVFAEQHRTAITQSGDAGSRTIPGRSALCQPAAQQQCGTIAAAVQRNQPAAGCRRRGEPECQQ